MGVLRLGEVRFKPELRIRLGLESNAICPLFDMSTKP